mmetsp:Transcript_2601/g.7832  ORF Transcript_2601/g.7832 Transcript_2601/m.7832 type:complete len:183 (-) Transcript_2601:140-688(-)|eukprot:CAMPEP_0198722562 /NCGR_PEP_ID=MMETSP1475-20131203/252_1 /TAXON_ID= ORGANISM="Unidentified sp., Strain CCMP1999" /NCGR_SAMPLE_ID=MMETSP1475 /ASSEMBLY_ACC=CAM_ASM_001111 /LENGTH=182 /DNA_ID=CAMNT_0044483475 /DNA_START=102 /DNA_END=650 /DNA_ORIENTATION=-
MASQPLVSSVVILNAEGMRICARYCNKTLFPDLEAERHFERELMKKVSIIAGGHDEDVFEMDHHIVVYKPFDDVVIFLTGAGDENELVLVEALRTYEDALSLLLRRMIDEENLLRNLESVLLAMDELIDQEGIILETDSTELAARIGGSSTGSIADGIPLGEQTLQQAFQSARDQLTRSILS